MPDPGPEAASIEEAYQDQIKELYKVLLTNLASVSVSHDTDQQCVGRFASGVKLSRRARDLALSALTGPAVPGS